LSFDNLSPERQEVVRLYQEGLTYNKIVERTGIEYRLVYQVIYRLVTKGMLPRRMPTDSKVKNKALEGVLFGQLGNAVRGLSAKDVLTLLGKMKRGETMSDMLVRVALQK
jgi:hypothetical protein